MDPFQINAAYRQQQLLDEASARGLARTGRGTASRSLAAMLAALGSRIGRPARLDRDRRSPAAAREAAI